MSAGAVHSHAAFTAARALMFWLPANTNAVLTASSPLAHSGSVQASACFTTMGARLPAVSVRSAQVGTRAAR